MAHLRRIPLILPIVILLLATSSNAQGVPKPPEFEPPEPVVIYGRLEIPRAVDAKPEAIQAVSKMEIVEAGTTEEITAVADIPLSPELQEHVHAEAERIGIEPYILFNLIWRESRFDTEAWRIDTNGLESVGLCQLNDSLADWMDERGLDPNTPEGNITAACELIAYYRDDMGCTLLESLAAFGAGYSGMKNGCGFKAASKLLERVDGYGEGHNYIENTHDNPRGNASGGGADGHIS